MMLLMASSQIRNDEQQQVTNYMIRKATCARNPSSGAGIRLQSTGVDCCAWLVSADLETFCDFTDAFLDADVTELDAVFIHVLKKC
jgi:hypothetical protein